MGLLTAKQTAKILQVSLPRVYSLARLGLLPCVCLGRQVRFNEESLREFLTRGGTMDRGGNGQGR
jgi:excisionase family DNA binding protein